MAYLKNVLLANNPDAGGSGGWSAKVGRTYDLMTAEYLRDGSWSIAANYKQIGPGTVGWIRRPCDRWQRQRSARWGYIAGLVVFTDTPKPVKERKGVRNQRYSPIVTQFALAVGP